MKLSVLVPHMTERKETLARLLWNLLPQPGANTEWEVWVNRRTGQLGDKLNELIGKARGEYVVVVGDDDWLPGFYMQKVLPVLDRDMVGYRMAILVDGRYRQSMPHSADMAWTATTRPYVPQMPVRKRLVEDLVFGNDYGSDQEWSRLVTARIGSHRYVDEDLYVYDHWVRREGEWSEARKVGRWPYDPTGVCWI